MVRLNHNMLTQVFNRGNLDKEFTSALINTIEKYGNTFKINTSIRLIRFLAQVVAEIYIDKHGKPVTRESLNYTPSRLITFSSYFRKRPKLAFKYGRTFRHKANQKAIANIWYSDENRNKYLKLGNTEPNDGWLYRGAGVLQTTGKYNLEHDINTINELTDIKLHDNRGKLIDGVLDRYDVFILLGMAYWYNHKCYLCKNTLCVTNIINRGLKNKYKIARTKIAVRIKRLLMGE